MINVKLKKLDVILVNGREMAVSKLMSQQLEYKQGGETKRGKIVEYSKPDITVYRIHHGKVLTSSDKYIGQNYEIKGGS